MMSDSRDNQAVFMEAMNSLKEYARVNGGFVTKEDVLGYFKGMSIDDTKLQMIYGYLMANNIKVKGEDQIDNSFLKMMEDSTQSEDAEGAEKEEASEDKERLKEEINKNLNYEEDEKYLTLYKEDLKSMEKLSDTSRAFLLMNIVEDNDKESLQLFSQSFLEKILVWIEPFRNQGVLASDLVQEGNLAMMAYVADKRFANNYEWKDKIKEGNTEDLVEVLHAIDEDVKSDIEGSIRMMLDEQYDSATVSTKLLNKVNLVNDWAKRLRDDMGRKPTVKEIADKMGISTDKVEEAIQLSAEAIEDIDTGKKPEDK